MNPIHLYNLALNFKLEKHGLPVVLLLLLCTPCHCAEGLKDRDPDWLQGSLHLDLLLPQPDHLKE